MAGKVGKIESIAGPVVRCSGIPAVRMYEVVRVGKEQLIGEVIEVGDKEFTAQVYEETSGLAPGEPVAATGDALSVELGPGLLGGIYDGIQRPLPGLQELSGDFITRGLSIEGLDKEKKWEFSPTVKVGDKVEPGNFIGEVPETGIITSKIMIPQGVEGEVVEIVSKGEYTVIETICKVKDVHGDVHDVMMMQKTPVRVGRPFKERVPLEVPLLTGQRVIDTFMPQAKGGTGAIPGGFGTGKTVTLHQFAKWADAQVVVYVGCGERGNEMTEALEEWPHLNDPQSGRPLMERTVLIANTSNMPVA
ncbi:MAG: V-type ATP synthase subunit A, partial [Candidatus Thorarchaeota archaeon]|nr:V-type ATP synthase subunit A [Candidatus Thorarchaeota archaeon]